ncbi:MAG: right-handed parallel beta-helix repeat-containing protein [Candidatus Omnitrophica bacterium]|nr:right-handed parallel beta-helix repeat-containing protein [Candidatus Omnitrophota bacterium]
MRGHTFLWVLALFMLPIHPLLFSAEIIVKQDGTGDAATIQAALYAAQDGDTIIIDDDGLYVEDCTASPALALLGIPSAPLSSFTLKAAEGRTPVIEAANADSSQRMAALGIEGKDMLGFVVWGCTGVSIQGIEFITNDNEVNAFNVQSIMVIADSENVSIENCTFRGPNARSSGEGNAVLIAGVQAQPYLPDNIVVRDCLITETHYGVISAVFQKGSGADPNRVTIEDCQFIDGFESAVDVDNARQMTIRNCSFDNYNHGIHFAGGNSLVEDCTIINSKDVGLDCDVDTSWTDAITGGIVRRCAIIGNGVEVEAAGVRCADGPLRFENCIIAGNSGPGVEISSGSDMDVDAAFDHCDIYENYGLSEVFVRADGDHDAKLTITNSNIVSAGFGIENELDSSAVIAHHNNVFVKGDAYYNVEAADSISVDPLYVSPTNDPADFSFDDFQLQADSPVLTSSENGTALGSHGSSDTFIRQWIMY